MTEPRLQLHRPGIAHHSATPERVSLPLGDLLPPLADAIVNDRQWLYDFAHEPISISKDLAEILQNIAQLHAQKSQKQQKKAA